MDWVSLPPASRPTQRSLHHTHTLVMTLTRTRPTARHAHSVTQPARPAHTAPLGHGTAHPPARPGPARPSLGPTGSRLGPAHGPTQRGRRVLTRITHATPGIDSHTSHYRPRVQGIPRVAHNVRQEPLGLSRLMATRVSGGKALTNHFLPVGGNGPAPPGLPVSITGRDMRGRF